MTDFRITVMNESALKPLISRNWKQRFLIVASVRFTTPYEPFKEFLFKLNRPCDLFYISVCIANAYNFKFLVSWCATFQTEFEHYTPSFVLHPI